MFKTNPKLAARLRRKQRIRKRIKGTGKRPRLAVFRSNKNVFAQIIDDEKGVTLAAASSIDREIRQRRRELGSKKDVAAEVGRMLATIAGEKGIKRVAFDRGGNLYHGRVKALADAAREGGLEF